MKQPRYLGDGVYAQMDGGDLILTTGNHYPGEDRIVIDRSVWGALCRYMEPEEAEPAGEE